MPRRKSYQYDASAGAEAWDRPSRSQKKRESLALQTLGEELAALPLRLLERLELTPDLLAAFRELNRLSAREARRRHMQYIGRLMREVDNAEELQDAVQAFREGRLS